jgi:hypothetical protein
MFSYQYLVFFRFRVSNLDGVVNNFIQQLLSRGVSGLCFFTPKYNYFKIVAQGIFTSHISSMGRSM